MPNVTSPRTTFAARPLLATAVVLLTSTASACRHASAEHAGAPAPASGAQSREAFARAMPAMDGNHLRLSIVEVTYAPGGSSSPHRHPCPVVGYVVRGAVRMQGEGAPETTYHAGDTFYESANAPHLVSANASATEPVTFLATFLCDHETKLTLPLP